MGQSAQKQYLVFLGGTCGSNNWREEKFFPLLDAYMISRDLAFNPVLPPGQWNEEFQKIEDEVKQTARYNLFYISNPQGDSSEEFAENVVNAGYVAGADVSAFSIFELTVAALLDSERTLIVFNTEAVSEHTAKVFKKIKDELRKFGVIFDSLEDVVKFLGRTQYS